MRGHIRRFCWLCLLYTSIEKLETSVKRLKKFDIEYIELHGNHYGVDLGYSVKETKQILKEYGISCGGVCGMFSPECDLSSNLPRHRQAAIDYLKREIEFTAEMGGEYLLVVPAAVGRAKAVSYTHLDVYKRQDYYCDFNWSYCIADPDGRLCDY